LKAAGEKDLDESFELERYAGVVEDVCGLYPVVEVDERFWTAEGELCGFTNDVLLEFIVEVGRLDTSPGLPFTNLGCPEVRDVLTKYPDLLCDLVRERLAARLSISVGELSIMRAEDLLIENLRDVLRVFVKNEPHDEAKIEAGRFRLIMNTSIVDIVVDRICLEALARAEVEVWDCIPSKPGMGLDDESIALLINGLPSITKPKSSDAKAWDWHMRLPLFLAVAAVEIRQYRVDKNS